MDESTNDTHMDNTTELFKEKIDTTYTQFIVINAFSITIAVFGTAGNSIVIAAILYGKLYHQSIYVKILQLLVCNLIHCCFALPMITIQAFTGIWADKRLFCNLISYVIFCNMGTELLGYVCISLNRYFCIVNRRIYQFLYGNSRILALEFLITWSIYPVILAFPLFGVFSHYEYVPRKLVCHPFLGTECTGYCLFVFVFALVTTIPVIGFCYMEIIFVYIRIQRKIGTSRDTHMELEPQSPDNQKRETFNSSLDTTVHQKEPPHRVTSLRRKSELKMAFTIFAIILLFGICRIPFIALYMYDPSMSKINPLIHTIVIYSGSNLNWVNPIIYALTNKQIRNTLIRMKSALKSTKN